MITKRFYLANFCYKMSAVPVTVPTTAMTKKPEKLDNLIAKNKKAFHDYEVIDKLEAGIVLNGPEVKSCRAHQVNLKGSYVSTFKEEAFAEGIHISTYAHSRREDFMETRRRKLLLHRKEIDRLAAHTKEKGIAVIPLELYFKGSLIKLLIGICRGRKLYDKRAMLKKRDIDREINRAVAKRVRMSRT